MLNACPTLNWKDKSLRPWSLNTIRARIKLPCVVLVMVKENDEGVARNLGIPWIPQSPERSSGTGGACRIHELILDSVIRWPVATWSVSVVCVGNNSPAGQKSIRIAIAPGWWALDLSFVLVVRTVEHSGYVMWWKVNAIWCGTIILKQLFAIW